MMEISKYRELGEQYEKSKADSEILTLEELKSALETFERIPADEKILNFSKWYVDGGSALEEEDAKKLTKARKSNPEYLNKPLADFTKEDLKYLDDYIEAHPEIN